MGALIMEIANCVVHHLSEDLVGEFGDMYAGGTI